MQIWSCKKCGDSVESDAEFCGHCGDNIQEQIRTDLSNTHAVSPSLIQISKPSPVRIRTTSTNIKPGRRTPQPNKPTRNFQTSHSGIKIPIPSVLSEGQHSVRFWAIWIGIILVVVTILLVPTISLISYYSSPALQELQTYCNALKGTPQYDVAYAQLSSKATGQSALTEDEFTARVKTIISSQDGIGDCAADIGKQFGDIVHGTITYTYGNGSKATKNYEVFNSHSGLFSTDRWLIETKDWRPSDAPVA